MQYKYNLKHYDFIVFFLLSLVIVLNDNQQTVIGINTYFKNLV